MCMIINRGKGIFSALWLEEVGWEVNGLKSVYYICHPTSNFKFKLKNQELKKIFINIGTSLLIFATKILSIFFALTLLISFITLLELMRLRTQFWIQNFPYWESNSPKRNHGLIQFYYKSSLMILMKAKGMTTWWKILMTKERRFITPLHSNQNNISNDTIFVCWTRVESLFHVKSRASRSRRYYCRS